jgi:hypothetical protein
MRQIPARRLYATLGLAAAIVFATTPASAQYTPQPSNEPATGERYFIEGAADLWFPTADMFLTSESLGIQGNRIDFKTDLGLTDQRFPVLQLQLRPARSHKFRFQYIPISYSQTATVKRDIIFNGQRYTIGLPVNSTLDWKAYRFGYEFDFITKARGFGGFIVEAKYTDITATLTAPIRSLNEFDRARAPIPAIGGIARVYVVPNLSITGEVTGFALPGNAVKNATGHYVDVDVYGTLNFTNNIGVRGGYRSLDLGYTFKTDNGSFTLKGIYFGAVARY